MRIIQEFTDKELKALLNDFYQYFSTGFEFEDFLKPFLESLGLSEVVVTKKIGDGGVDLMAIKTGLAEINNMDSVKYRVQAKRNDPSSTIAPEKIDALRGNLGFNEKGLFITTAKVSKQAKEKAFSKDLSKPVFVIDGRDLVTICIDKQIGFAYRPMFSKAALDEFTNKLGTDAQASVENIPIISNAWPKPINLNFVTKRITINDIRCSLISVPKYICDKINNNETKHMVKVIFNGNDMYELTFSPARKYLYVPTGCEIFKKFGLRQVDGVMTEKDADWAIADNQTIYINIQG